MDNYWDKRFDNEGMIWGQQPSKTVYQAIELFKNNKVKTVLVPGSGYGRNTKALSKFFQVDGIELSHKAIHIAMHWDPYSHFIQGSVMDDLTGTTTYDAIYCFDVLHLFLEDDRKNFINNCVRQLKHAGVMYFTCFSNEDHNNGVGRQLEDGTYEYVEGKYAHFFTEKDLINHFKDLKVIGTGTTQEIFNYKEKQSKKYIIRYIIVKKTG
ncbi:class I SAM-dependent methyltransferase [Paenibacillus sp. GCM10012306]|uniref:class I SAM-dependent methyltransferase n=1 Tax=Paenibacillus sp. GCM10012306 TaxID=3317342 RepID=UPI003621242A